jgi:RNA polymerase sigma factor (sigma-70 family)
LPAYPGDEPDDEVLNDLSEVLLDETSPSPETEYLHSLVWIELENALSELPPEQREIFELTELDDIPVKEISEITGVPVNTLLSRKRYAVKHLRKRLEGLYREIVYS